MAAAPQAGGFQLVRLRPAPPRGVLARPPVVARLPFAALARRAEACPGERVDFPALERADAGLVVRPAVLFAVLRVAVRVVRVLPAAFVWVPAAALARVAAVLPRVATATLPRGLRVVVVLAAALRTVVLRAAVLRAAVPRVLAADVRLRAPARPPFAAAAVLPAAPRVLAVLALRFGALALRRVALAPAVPRAEVARVDRAGALRGAARRRGLVSSCGSAE